MLIKTEKFEKTNEELLNVIDANLNGYSVEKEKILKQVKDLRKEISLKNSLKFETNNISETIKIEHTFLKKKTKALEDIISNYSYYFIIISKDSF